MDFPWNKPSISGYPHDELETSMTMNHLRKDFHSSQLEWKILALELQKKVGFYYVDIAAVHSVCTPYEITTMVYRYVFINTLKSDGVSPTCTPLAHKLQGLCPSSARLMGILLQIFNEPGQHRYPKWRARCHLKIVLAISNHWNTHRHNYESINTYCWNGGKSSLALSLLGFWS